MRSRLTLTAESRISECYTDMVSSLVNTPSELLVQVMPLRQPENESHRPWTRVADRLGITRDDFSNHRYMVSSMLLDLYRGGQPHNTYTFKAFTINPRSRVKPSIPAPITTTSLTCSDMTQQVYGPSRTGDGGNRWRIAEVILDWQQNKISLCIPSAKPPPLQGILLNPILCRFHKVDSTYEIPAR